MESMEMKFMNKQLAETIKLWEGGDFEETNDV